MDPRHAALYATAQVELRELFLRISVSGGVGPSELQTSLLPFAAGDVRRDVQQLADDLRRQRTVLDEAAFARALWKRMYLPHVLLADQVASSDAAAAAQELAVNIPFTHMLVGVKRRAQMQQFASYYKSRGISGADRLTARTRSADPQNDDRSPVRSTRKQATEAALYDHQQASRGDVAVDLRKHRSRSYDIVICVFDGAERILKTHIQRQRVRFAQARTCSSLYCLLFTQEIGVVAIGSSYVAREVQTVFHNALDRYNASESGLRHPIRPARIPVPASKESPELMQVRLDDIGLRNVTTVAAGKGTFTVSTGRKLHQWKAPEPLRVFRAGFNNGQQSGPSIDEDEDVTDDLMPDPFEELEQHAEGDCLGLLSGTKLLGRTKTVVDCPGVTNLVASDALTIAQTTSGELFAWQRDSVANNPDKPIMSKISMSHLPSERVRRVACGRRHTIAITSSGGAFVWGSNEYGQLGLGDDLPILDRQVPTPTRLPLTAEDGGAIKNSVKPLDVACGDDHSLILTTDGGILAFGCNWFGQLGLGQDTGTDGCVFSPQPLNLPSGMNGTYLITAQSHSSAAVSPTAVFQWGRCVPSGAASVCGLVSRWLPERVDELEEAAHEAGGHASSSAPEQGQLNGTPAWHSIAIAHGVIVLTRHMG